jgi:SAM-dependent methyltransferase
VAWVLDLAGLSRGLRVLDAGCGNGEYLRALGRRPAHAAGCDLSMGMLRTAACPALFNADVAALPVRDGAFDVVLAADYVASLASHYQGEVAPGPRSSRPWARCRP